MLASQFEKMGVDINLDEPYKIFKNLTQEQVEELFEDITFYLRLEKDTECKLFWEAMVLVCQDELDKLRLKSAPTGFRTGVNAAVLEEINKMLEKKSVKELDELKRQVDFKLKSGGPIDVEYWEALVKGILVWRSKAKLRNMHARLLEKRLEQLKKHPVDQVELPPQRRIKRQAPKEPLVAKRQEEYDQDYDENEAMFIDTNLRVLVDDRDSNDEDAEEQAFNQEMELLDTVSFISFSRITTGLSLARQVSSQETKVL